MSRTSSKGGDTGEPAPDGGPPEGVAVELERRLVGWKGTAVSRGSFCAEVVEVVREGGCRRGF